MKLNPTLRFLSFASLLTASALSKAQSLADDTSRVPPSERFVDFLSRVTAESEPLTREKIIAAYLDKVKAYGRAIIHDSTVYFMYYGTARRVGVPSDLNGWNPVADTMKRVGRTGLFYLAKKLDDAARFEYKLVVDSTWILDPLNRQQAFGGYGPNSEVWMPHYAPPEEIIYRSAIAHGTVDTVMFKSKILGRTHPVFIYLPPNYSRSRRNFPSIYVTDGGEYISLALMLNVLDNLIADKRIRPVVGIFIDPRTNPANSQTSMRMVDYTLSDTFVNALITELRPRLLTNYRLVTEPQETAIMGASLGGLIATYAAFTHPEVFGLCAAQSPAYMWRNSAILKLVEAGPKKAIKFYIDTGTIRDSQQESLKMRNLLLSKGCEVMYQEHPESHNWVNWRARLSDILQYFWGTAR